MRRLMVALSLVAGTVTAQQTIAPVPASAAMTVEVGGMAVTPVLSGMLGTAIGMRFAPDGRIYVAVKDGRVAMYDAPGDTTATTTLDIRTSVSSNGDRGLLGIALDPAFASGRPYLYVLYTYDRDPFGDNTSVPRWSDTCPSATEGCSVSARLDRYTVNSSGIAVGAPVRLLDGADGPTGGWCNQFTSHSIGTVDFGRDGMLYVGSGDGASYNLADFGREGGSDASPPNPCNDRQDTVPRSGGRGTPLVASTSRGGALRSQNVRDALANEYVSWDGAILRIDPNTGAAAPGNPLIGNGIAGDDRIVAYGLRNPYRFSLRPSTDELWLADVGWNTWEEVDTFTTGPSQSTVPNFGWPCYEGNNKMGAYDALDIGLCERLYASTTSSLGGVSSPLKPPTYAWSRYNATSTTDLPCATTAGGGSATGGGFVANPDWPTSLRGTYVFGDYARRCLMAMPLTDPSNPLSPPDPTKVTALVSDTAPVSISVGPGGDIYWIDVVANTLNRLRPISGNLAPVASFTATQSPGTNPFAFQFDASATTDPNQGEVLTYTWDLDGDGQCDDGSGRTIGRTYAAAGTVAVMLCVRDQIGATDSTVRQIQPGNSAPVITGLTTSADASGWRVGDVVTYGATATDADQTLPPSAFTWTSSIRHCDNELSTACHLHSLGALPAGVSGSLTMPDHEYYASVQLTLTVTDSGGSTSTRTVDLRPRTSSVTLQTSPPGIEVAVGGRSGASPLTVPFLEGGRAQLTVPNTVVVGGVERRFVGWSDGAGVVTARVVAAPPGGATYQAVYDSVAPTVGAVSVDAATLDPRTSSSLRVTADLTDDVGVDAAVVELSGPGPTVYSAVLAPPPDTTLGTWTGVVTVPANAPLGDYAVRVVATDRAGRTGTGVGPSVTFRQVESLPPGTAGSIRSVTPFRLLDTRLGIGAPVARVEAGGSVRVQVGGLPDVPAGTTGVVVNITAVNGVAAGYVTAYPCGAVPTVSNVNPTSAAAVANLATVTLDAGGGFCLTSMRTTDLVVDLSAVVLGSGQTGERFTGITPHRVVDTRDGIGAAQRPLRAGEIVTIPLDTTGLPGDAGAVIANVTVVNPVAAGFVTAFPCGGVPPTASNVNYSAGQIVSNLILTSLGDQHQLCVTSLVATDLVVDVSGWTAPSGATVASTSPRRALDTRLVGGRLQGGSTMVVDAATLGLPVSATAVIANITAVDTGAPGFLTVYPCDAARPLASGVNHGGSESRPGLSITTFGPSRTMCIYTLVDADIVVDVQGWTVAAGATEGDS